MLQRHQNKNLIPFRLFSSSDVKNSRVPILTNINIKDTKNICILRQFERNKIRLELDIFIASLNLFKIHSSPILILVGGTRNCRKGKIRRKTRYVGTFRYLDRGVLFPTLESLLPPWKILHVPGER